MAVDRFSRPLSGVGVIIMPDAGLDALGHLEVPPSAGVLRLLRPCVVVGVFIDRLGVVGGVEVTP